MERDDITKGSAKPILLTLGDKQKILGVQCLRKPDNG